MKYTIEVLKRRRRIGKSKYYWRLKHENGEILAHSENYSSHSKAIKTATKVLLNFKSGSAILKDNINYERVYGIK